MTKKILKKWLSAFRLRTLPLSLSAIIMGAFIAKQQLQFDHAIFIWSLVTTVLLQVLSNLANDYGDFINGADDAKRVGPQRAVQSGEITAKSMKRAMYIFAGLSLISGIVLLLQSFPDQWILFGIFFVIGLLAIWSALNYTAGDSPYGYAGFGDVFVFLFFGIIGVGGSYYLHTQTIDLIILLPSVTLGALSTMVLNLNNLRDIENDERVGKRTIPVRLGFKQAKIYHFALYLMALISLITFFAIGNRLDFFAVKIWPLYLIPFVIILKTIGHLINEEKPQNIDRFLKPTALNVFLITILCWVAFYIG